MIWRPFNLKKLITKIPNKQKAAQKSEEGFDYYNTLTDIYIDLSRMV